MKALLPKIALTGIWQDFWTRYYFKFVLPKLTQTEIDGLKLDLSTLSLKARNRIVNVGYETFEKELCKEYLGPEDAVLELGAAIGFISLYCQKKIGVKYYAAFEANPRTLEVLRTNHRLNGLEPNAWNLALAERDGQVELNIDNDFWENSIIEGKSKEQGKKSMDVPAATLRTVLRTAGHRVNVLIIDIEGAEQYIDPNDIPPEVDKIIIELHPQVIGQASVDRFVAGVLARGFCVAKESGGTFAFLRKYSESPNGQTTSLQKFEHSSASEAIAGHSS